MCLNDVWMQGFSVTEQYCTYGNFWVATIKYIMHKTEELNVITTLLTKLYVRIGILLIYGIYFHDHIISLRGESLVHRFSLTPPLWLKCLY